MTYNYAYAVHILYYIISIIKFNEQRAGFGIDQLALKLALVPKRLTQWNVHREGKIDFHLLWALFYSTVRLDYFKLF